LAFPLPQKNIAPWTPPIYPRKLQPETGVGLNVAEYSNMRNCAARLGGLWLFPAILVCSSFPSFRACAQGFSTGGNATRGIPTTQELGTGVFAAVPFKIALDLRGGYDDNVTTFNVEKQGSGYTTGSIKLDYDFGSPRTRFTLEGSAGATYFWDRVQNVGVDNNDYDITTSLRVSLLHKASPRLTLTIAAYLSYQTEPDFTLTQGLNRRVGNFFITSDRFGVSYHWTPRFSTSTSYSLNALIYDDSAVGQFEDRFENTFGNEFRYLILPTTSLIAGYRFQVSSYVHESRRDSISQYFLGGVEHEFNPRLRGSVHAGAQFRDYEEGNSRTSPYFEGSLTYAFGKQTSIGWVSRYSIEDGDVATRQGRETFRTGLHGNYDFTPRIRGSIGANYQHHDYQSFNAPGAVQSGSAENLFDLELSLHYSVTRYFGLQAGYNYTEVSSDIPLREYSRNRYWAGVHVTF
jgi:hypothetical protein